MLKERIGGMLKALNTDLYERDVAIQLALLTTLAGESIFLLGKPGVAKSLIARRLKDLFKDGEAFEYLMNRFSTPDEIFGPIAISKLKNEDKYERKTEKYLPKADVVFLDEIWKAGPSIQNALLTVINEKIYRNGTEDIKIPLKVLIAASNELPAKDQGLGALWDRFIVRYIVNSINDDDTFTKYLTTSNVKPFKISEKLKITDSEFKDWKKEIDKVTVSQQALNIVKAIRHYIKAHNKVSKTIIYVSDRRWKKIIHLLKTSAFFNDRKVVNTMDCALIVHTIWDNESQINIVNGFVVDAIKLHSFNNVFDYKIINEEVNVFKKEVNKAIKAKVEEVYFLPIQYERGYYQLETNTLTKDNWNGPDVYIKISDFNRLNSNTFITLEIYNRINTYGTYGNNFEVKLIDDNTLSIRRNQSGNKGTKIKLKSTKKTRKVDGVKKPTTAVLNHLNKKAELLLEATNTQQTCIETHIKEIDKNLGTHLFVPNSYNLLFTMQLDSLLKSFIVLKSDILKVQNSYEQL